MPVTVKRGDLELVATDDDGLRMILRVLGHTPPPAQLGLGDSGEATADNHQLRRRRNAMPPAIIENPTPENLRRVYRALEDNSRRIVDALYATQGPVLTPTLASAIGSDKMLSVAGTMTTISRRARKLGVPKGAVIDAKQGMVAGKFQYQYRLTPAMREALDGLKKTG